MKFECKSKTLIGAINQTSKARSKSMSQEYLQDIYFVLDDHQLTLRATNLEIFCEKSISVKGIQNGKCVLKGETLVKITNLLQKEDINLICELIDNIFIIKGEKENIEIKTILVEDFPSLPKQGELIGEIKINNLISLIKSVSFCSASTEIKPEISSIFIFSKDDELYSVATDSYRLAEKHINNETNLNISILIPQKNIVEIINILQEEEGSVSFYKNEGLITLNVGDLSLAINTILGQFPDYKQLFPKEYTTICNLNKNELQKALTLTTYFTEQYSQVKCKIEGDKLTLHSKNEQIGQVTNTIEIKKEGEDLEVSYNNKYFLDVFPYINGEIINLSLTTPQKPLFIQSKEDLSFVYLLMPLNR